MNPHWKERPLHRYEDPMISIQIEIKSEAHLAPEQRRELDALLKEAFKDDVDPGYHWAQPTIHMLAYTGGRLVSYAGILERQILVGGRRILAAGITDVATDVNFRGQGWAHIIMKAVLGFVSGQGRCQFLMLFCNKELVPLYESCGYRKIEAPLFIHSEGRRFQINEIKMILPITKMDEGDGEDMAGGKNNHYKEKAAYSASQERWPEGEIDLLGLPW
jgi:GNAT superfamily N-acetyltransferase